MKKNLLILIAFLAGSQVLAQTNLSTNNFGQVLNRNAVKPWSLEFLVASEQTKDIVTKKIDGQYNKMDMSVLQGLTSKDELRYYLSSRYIMNEAEPEQNEFDWFFTEFMYRRRGILTEDQYGFNLDFEFKNLYYLDSEIRDSYAMNGTTIPQIIINRNIGKYGSTQLRIRKHFNHTNSDDAYTVQSEDRVYLSYARYIPHGMLAYAQLKYQHKFRKGTGPDWRFSGLAYENGRFNPRTRSFEPDFSYVPTAKQEQEIVTFHPSMMFFLNRENMMEVYYETKLSNTYDKRDLQSIMADESVFGVAFYLTAY